MGTRDGVHGFNSRLWVEGNQIKSSLNLI